jgi:solute carrier family 35 protein F1/2
MDSSDQKVQLPESDVPEVLYDASSQVRPPIEYTSVSAFLGSSARRFKSLWTRRFTLSLLAGQLVSLCITCTNVTTTELVNRYFNRRSRPGILPHRM